MVSDILGAATNVPLQSEDEDDYDVDFGNRDQRDWILAKTKVERLTLESEMKPRAVQ